MSDDKAMVPVAPARKALATICIMAATVLVVIDQTIAVIVLPHMQAALGASPDTINWVLTSYIMATAISTPLTGWLTGRFGRTRFFAAAIIGFTISSVLCGVAVSLPMMVAARVLQGFFGAFMVPMSQTFLYDMNPPSQQVRALSIWGAGVIAAPILGPVLGGYLTETFDWRWVFFINVPIGILAAAGVLSILPHFPAARRSFDHIGFILISFAMCGLQIALDRGTQQDWLDSPEILIEFAIFAAASWMLFFHLRHARHPLIPVGLFRTRAFSAALVMAVIVVPVVTAASALLPPLLQVLLGYPIQWTAIIMIPRALAIMASILASEHLMKLFDGRWQIFFGISMIAWSLQMQTGFTIVMGSDLVIWSGLLQGWGLGMTMTVINYATISSIPPAMRTEGAALYTLVRSIGSSIAIATCSALLAYNMQVNHAEVGGSIRTQSLPMSELFVGVQQAAAIANAEVSRQSMMIAYIDDFWMMMWACLATLPLLLLLKPIRPPARGEAPTIIE